MATAPKELFDQVLGYFVWAWRDNSFNGSTQIRLLYPDIRQWVQLKIVFDEAPWVKARHFKLAQKDFAPARVRTIQNVADVIATAATAPKRHSRQVETRMETVNAQLAAWRSPSNIA